MTEWKPIETAPKDREILVLLSNNNFAVVNWCETSEKWWVANNCFLSDEAIKSWRVLPNIPQRKHRCISNHNKDWYCETEKEGNILRLTVGSFWLRCDFCPFCGEKA